MASETDELIEWLRSEQEEARRQLTLFGTGGVRAILQMPDGATQDITEGVIRHQTGNIAAFDRLVAALGR